MFIDEEQPLDQDELIRKMVGRPLTNLYPVHESKLGDEIMRVENWTVHSPLSIQLALLWIMLTSMFVLVKLLVLQV